MQQLSGAIEVLRLNDDQILLRDSVRRYLADKSPESVVRAQMETEAGYDRARWKGMADDLGLQSIIVPEQFGGLGLSYVDLCVAFEEMGRVLFCGPFFSTIGLATNLLLELADESASADYLPRIAAGELTATVAYAEGAVHWEPDEITLEARHHGQTWQLSGKKSFVVDGCTADLILVVARTDTGLGVFAVPGKATGISCKLLNSMDQTRKLAEITFLEVEARQIAGGEDSSSAIQRAFDLATVALVAEQIGGSERLLEMSVDYAKFRVQFGRQIGSFQAIKHKCADMLLEIESAKAAAHEAYRLAESRSPDLPMCTNVAKAYGSEAYFKAAAENIQIHGGIGFTWEHPAHLYFKRAKSSEFLLGTPEYHRERYMTLSGL